MSTKSKGSFRAAKFKRDLNRVGNWANLISLSFSLIFGVASIFIATKSGIDDKYLTIGIICVITIANLFIFMYLYLFVHGRLSDNYLKIINLYLESEKKLNSNSAAMNKNATSHRELGGVVDRFLTAVFNYMENSNNHTQGKTGAVKLLETATNEFYIGICDCAVNYVSALKNGHVDSFHSNLKIFSAAPGGKHRYKTVGRSRNTVTTQPERPRTDERANEGYIVQKNAIYSKLILEENHKRKLAVSDIFKKIPSWSLESGGAYSEPTQGAGDFYNNCCCVLIYGGVYIADNVFSLDDFPKIGSDKFAIGVITVDSLNYDFDVSTDCDFLQELSDTVFQMIKLKNLIQNIA